MRVACIGKPWCNGAARSCANDDKNGGERPRTR